MSQQLKTGLLLHLDQNKNFIQEKVYKQFAVQCLQYQKLAKLSKTKMIDTIKFIFDFGNQEMNGFYKKLPANIQNFLKMKVQELKGKALFDLQILMELIYYCVNNGFPQKPKEIKQQKIVNKQQSIEKPPVTSERQIKQQVKKQIKKKIKKKVKQVEQEFRSVRDNPQVELIHFQKVVKKPKQNNAKPRIQTHLDLPKIQKTQFKIQKYTMPEKNVLPRYLQVKNIQPAKIQNQTEVLECCQPLPQDFIKNNQNLLRERLRHIYQHYCSQQQNVGHSPTFDKIRAQMQKMNIGKFLLFLKFTKLFNLAKSIKKQNILSIYRKISEGRQQITFQQFQTILKILDQKYIQEIKGIKTEQIPSFQARLFLHDADKYKQLKKNVNMIFFTRDNKNQSNTLTQSYRRDLTSHSGKTARQLQEDLSRKQYQSIDLNSTIQRQKTRKVSNVKKVNLKNIQSTRFPILDWLQEQERNDDQTNRNINKINNFANMQRKKDIVGSIKKRVNEVSRLEDQRA